MFDHMPARGPNRDELSQIEIPSRVVTTTQASLLDLRNRARERALRGEELALLLAMGVEVRETAPLFVAA